MPATVAQGNDGTLRYNLGKRSELRRPFFRVRPELKAEDLIRMTAVRVAESPTMERLAASEGGPLAADAPPGIRVLEPLRTVTAPQKRGSRRYWNRSPT